MENKINYVHFTHTNHEKSSSVKDFGVKEAQKARDFHRTFPEYEATPLADLKNLARVLGLGSIHVKDESYRFGLNAFKVLGGSYALGSFIAKRLGMDISELPYEKMVSEDLRKKLGELTFVTATDGNHGRGIAWTASRLHQKAVVYMPRGSSPERLRNIQALGAEASITDMNYDEAVDFARSQGEKNGWIMVQDTAWEGYEEIPKTIMQGYTTMALEAVEQLQGEKPTHIFLQAGVGAMSGAVTGFFTDYYGEEDRPVITIVEPDQADCLYRTALTNDGKLHTVTGPMHSIMAGLCCGVPCTLGWNILKDHSDNFISIPDTIAAKGMRILGNPMGDDPRVISGESGAATLGFLARVMTDERLSDLKETIGLDKDSRVLLISTEGDTDRENYRRIVWDGLYPSF